MNLRNSAVFWILVFAVGSCANRGSTAEEESAMPARPIEAVLATHTDSLMSVPGVIGTAQGSCDGEPCIKVFITRQTPELRRRIPDRLEGYAVQLETTGEFRIRRDTNETGT
jgi:hypothetical protein